MDAKEVQRSLSQELGDQEERYLRETLVMLQESYARAAEPYIKRLVLISNRRPPAPIVIPIDQAQALGLLPANAIGQGSAACGASPAPTGCASGGEE